MPQRKSSVSMLAHQLSRFVIKLLPQIMLLAPFAITPAHAQTFTVLHSFNGTDGYSPDAGVTLDAGGNLYGTTQDSLTGDGTVFELKRSHSAWILNTLFTFTGSDGAYPFGGVVFGPDGALFGTTPFGGLGTGPGVVYSLKPPRTACKTALCGWSQTLLYEFTGGADGNAPYLENLTFDHAGNIYGTTSAGGAFGYGTVFELTRSNGGWTEEVLYSFAGGNDGRNPESGVVFDSAGNLYGTTSAGVGSGCSGNSGCGTVYQLTPSGSGWTEHVLYAFRNDFDGANPYGPPLLDQAGNVFGGTSTGGGSVGGTVYELSPSGGSWTFTLLTALVGEDFGGVYGNLATDAAGNLYGVTDADGANYNGSVFKLTRQNGSWVYSTLHDFGYRGTDGSLPVGGPVVDSMGNIYGTAAQGGINQCGFEVTCGTVWEITP